MKYIIQITLTTFFFVFNSYFGFSQSNEITEQPSLKQSTLHAVFFADTDMSGFGSGIETAYFKMKDEATLIATNTDLTVKEYSFISTDFTKEKLLQLTNQLNVKEDDAILFYYIGEGFRYEDQQSKWPNLYLDAGKWIQNRLLEEKSVPLPEMYQQLKNKKPRLLICIADASHAKEFEKTPTYQNRGNQELERRKQTVISVDSEVKKQYKALYEKSSGSVLIVGCSPGQLAEIDPHPSRGSALSWAFLNASHQKYEEISWNILLEKTKSFTQGFFIGSNRMQTPFYVVEVGENVDTIPIQPPIVANASDEKAPKIWGVFIGISNYANPSSTLDKLHYTDDDAYLLYSFYKSPAGGALPDEQVTVLVDENATKEAILASVEKAVAKAAPQDIILVYYSGHGVNGGILPYDHYPEKESSQLSYEKIKTLLNKSKAKKKLIVSDACFAGTLVASRGKGKRPMNAFYQKLTQAKDGTILLASSRPREFSKEYEGLRQGVFSYFMMQGLKGQADTGSKDGIITIRELFDYVSANVTRRTDGEQNPMIYGKYDPETPLANVREKEKKSPLKVWAVIAGVSAYQTFNGLNYADDDAYQLYSFFKSPQGGALPDEQIKVLVDQNAYRENIVNALRSQLRKAGPNDLVIFYFAGHASEKAFYPYDYDGTANRLTYETVKTLFNGTRANKKLWIADACHSGGIKGTPIEAWQKIMVKQKGTALLMSSRKEQKSFERNDLRQGIFSYYLIKGLKGQSPAMESKAANADCDFTCKFITLQELFQYIKTNVERETNNTQRPDIDGDYNPAMPVGWIGSKK